MAIEQEPLLAFGLASSVNLKDLTKNFDTNRDGLVWADGTMSRVVMKISTSTTRHQFKTCCCCTRCCRSSSGSVRKKDQMTDGHQLKISFFSPRSRSVIGERNGWKRIPEWRDPHASASLPRTRILHMSPAGISHSTNKKHQAGIRTLRRSFV